MISEISVIKYKINYLLTFTFSNVIPRYTSAKRKLRNNVDVTDYFARGNKI